LNCNLINAALSVGSRRSGRHRPKSDTTALGCACAAGRGLCALSRITRIELEAGDRFQRLLPRLLSGEFGSEAWGWRRRCGGGGLEPLTGRWLTIADLEVDVGWIRKSIFFISRNTKLKIISRHFVQ
jgi:hypothetical protein